MNTTDRLHRAWLERTISQFQNESSDSLLGELARRSDTSSIVKEQSLAWEQQINLLQGLLGEYEGQIYFEFNVPRMGKRADVILIIDAVVFVVEFKVGEKAVNRADLNQAWDYALDLKNFHEASHDAVIVPMLFPTGFEGGDLEIGKVSDDGVWEPVTVCRNTFGEALNYFLRLNDASAPISSSWIESSYKPTPTIIEAARSMYSQHSVHEIIRSDAGARNISETSSRVEDIIDCARKNHEKAICFVTGVPGAGKTLVGLNMATLHSQESDVDHSVFLSGNGPLVAVLREALTRDDYSRRKEAGESIRKGEVMEKVKAFIQNVHHFRDECLTDPNNPPADHVVIFDESQRAWNKAKTTDFMKRRKGIANFDRSEPDFLISCMDRHKDWAVIICLVGGGQEIHSGEAGIGAWIEALEKSYPDWQVFVSDQLSEREYDAQSSLEYLAKTHQVSYNRSLHLATSMRSFRAENVSSFVKCLLDNDSAGATNHFEELADKYPIVVSRDITAAKAWLRNKARGNERIGMVASSKAQRLKPHAIDVRVEVNPIHYFLNNCEDVRSSYYLEDAATEFQIQGLELDWVLVNWDGDLRYCENAWAYHQFRGAKWININKKENRTYLINAYRVLLTRARQGMAIFVPEGDDDDPTRDRSFYDSTYAHLKSAGLPEI